MAKPRANLNNVEDFLFDLGPVRNNSVTYLGVSFAVEYPPTGLSIYVENPPNRKSDLNKFRNGIIKQINDNFSGVIKKPKDSTNLSNGSPYARIGNSFLTFDIDEFSSGDSGVIPTKIQEEGTVVVLNQVLHKNKKFNSKEDILNDKETAEELKKLFGKKYQKRLRDWTHSYYEQQKEFLKKFQSSKWDVFVYGSDDFVTFFSKQIKNVARSLDPLKPVGNYTTWNPSDIWAAYEMDKIKKDISENLNPKTQNLVELNTLLINLFEERKLIGLSLKKVAPNQSASLKFVNIDTSTMRLGDIEEYKMNDIKFYIDNIFTEHKVTTYIKFGKGDDYTVNITRAGRNLSFNTAIKRTPAAQGGQAPTKMIQSLIKRNGNGITFVNDHNRYPKSFEEYSDQSQKFSKMYEYVKKYFKKSTSYSEFEENLKTTYKKDSKNAVVKLMTLNFFYDTLRSNSNNQEFWTDILYLGMKVGKGFAPHAKIS